LAIATVVFQRSVSQGLHEYRARVAGSDGPELYLTHRFQGVKSAFDSALTEVIHGQTALFNLSPKEKASQANQFLLNMNRPQMTWRCALIESSNVLLQIDLEKQTRSDPRAFSDTERETQSNFDTI
jgi:hypothetical protein